MKPQDTLIWSHISEGGGKIEDAWKLVLAGGWLSSLFLGAPGLYAPPLQGGRQILCSPGFVLHWSSACLCSQDAPPYLCSMIGEDGRATNPGLEGNTVASEARRGRKDGSNVQGQSDLC